jgi:hypothetical protein
MGWWRQERMTENNGSNFSLETRVRGDDVRVVVERGKQKLGKLVLSGGTICRVPAEPRGDDEAGKMAWIMTWEQFAEAMESRELGEVVRLSQCAYTSAARADARIVRPEANVDIPMPKARENLGLRRQFNAVEFSLIRKGYAPEYDEKWVMLFDPIKDELRIYRSWTGHCIYGLNFREHSRGSEIFGSWVNRDPEQYESTNTKHDTEVANWLIDVFLLGRQRDFPSASKYEVS